MSPTRSEQDPDGSRSAAMRAWLAGLSVVLAIMPLASACGSIRHAAGMPAAPCPARLPGQPPLHARPGSSSRLVPGRPVVVTVCGYTSAGRLMGSRVSRDGADRLMTELNSLRHVPKPINFMCPNRPGGAFLLRFRYATGPASDVLVQGSNCRFASNGQLLAFTTVALQHRLAALAP